MVYISRIFKKEITVQIIGYSEEHIEDVAERIKSFVTPRFYNCDTKVVEGKLIVETDKLQIKANIEYNKGLLKSLRRERDITVSQSYRDVIDADIEKTKRKISSYEKLS